MSNRRNFNKHRNDNRNNRRNYNQPRNQNHSGQNQNGPNHSDKQNASPEAKSDENVQPIMNKPQEDRPKNPNPNFKDRKHRPDDRKYNDRSKQFDSEKKNSKKEDDEVVFPRKTSNSWAFASTSPKGFEQRKKVGSFDQLQDRRVRPAQYGDDDIWGEGESILDEIRDDMRLDLPSLDTISDLNGLTLQMNSLDYAELLSKSDEDYHSNASLDFSDD